MASTVCDTVLGVELNSERYVSLLRDMIAVSESVQNGPALGLVPNEDKVCDIVEAALADAVAAGSLTVERYTKVAGRSNLIITYPKADGVDPVEGAPAVMSFVGSHMDVVPANPETWNVNPFELTVDGDKLYGRGTTDCLGHVALITDWLLSLVDAKVELPLDVMCVFIASEEATSDPPGAGVESLLEAGKLEQLKGGTVLWVDSADSQPCIGTAGAIVWHCKAVGHLFHSGLPHKGINALELGMEAVAQLQEKFYAKFVPHPQEEVYKFSTSSTMKPTQMECAKGGFNQIPPHATISGDVRLTPFYEVADVIESLTAWVEEINANIETALPTRGPWSKYVIDAPGEGDEQIRGRIELTFGEEPMTGIACDLESPGYAALVEATNRVKGKAEPYAICGSLPLVAEMKEAGFDIQITGYGLSSVYHGDNEYCLLSDMQDAAKILSNMVHLVANSTASE